MSRSNLYHSLGLTARTGTGADVVPVSSQWVVSLFSDRERIQWYSCKNSTVQRKEEGEDAGMLQHLTI